VKDEHVQLVKDELQLKSLKEAKQLLQRHDGKVEDTLLSFLRQ